MPACGVKSIQDELLWGAAWLHKASRRREYREYIKKNEVVLGASENANEFGWENKHAGINVLISKVSSIVKHDTVHLLVKKKYNGSKKRKNSIININT